MYTIRKASIEDVDEITKLNNIIFTGTSAFDIEFLKDILNTKEQYNYVSLNENREIIGFLLTGYDDAEWGPWEINEYMQKHNDIELFAIMSLGVLEKYRNQKMATTLLNKLFEDINKDTEIKK